MEYEELLSKKMGHSIANNIINTILSSSYTKFINPYFRFELIQKDKDDNKFVDCAIQANARYIVTQDRHYDVLKDIKFPQVDVINIDLFLDFLNK